MEEERKLEEVVGEKKNERIQVAVRCRPFLKNDINRGDLGQLSSRWEPKGERGATTVFCDPEKNTIKVSDLTHVVESRYDKIFDQDSTQHEVFDFMKPGLNDLLTGINCTVFAYGQTGSGKTHTMFGPKWEESVASRLSGGMKNDFFSNIDNHGIIPRTISHLFSTVDMKKHTLYCSFIQIYNEKLYDLLQDPEIEHPLDIREDKNAGIFVEGLTEYVVEKDRDCFILLKRGERNRVTRSTFMNAASSRSHSIFQLLLESNKMDSDGMLMRAKLNLCDLAGSEKINKEEIMNEQHFEELKTINLSLTTLGKVISVLGKKQSKKHIPYRDSKITRFLQDSLGGRTKTFLVAAVSPGEDCVEETISTLKFADRAKQVMVRAKANTFKGSDDALVKRLQKEILHLRDILNIRRKGGQGELAEQLMQLKQENSLLKERNIDFKDVEKLMQENKYMKLELQKFMSNTNTSQNFNQNKNEGEDPTDNVGFTQYNTHQQWNEDEEAKPLSNGISHTKKPLKMQLDQSDAIGKENNNNFEQYRYSRSSFRQGNHFSPRETTNSGNDMFPSLVPNAPLSKMLENKLTPKKSRSNNSTNFSNFQMGSAHLKDHLSKKGRCPLCTLPLPCKHYNDISELPKLPPSKYDYTVPKVSESMPPISNTMRGSTLENQHFSGKGSDMRTTSPVGIPDIFNPQSYPPGAFSSRSSQKVSSFLNTQMSNENKIECYKEKRPQKDFEMFLGREKEQGLNANVRVRGRSNIVDTKQGNLLQSIQEQREEEHRKKELQQAKKRIKTLNKLEDFRQKKLEEEIFKLEQERRLKDKQIRKQKRKDAKRHQYFARQKAKIGQYQFDKAEKFIEQKEKEEKKRKMEQMKFLKRKDDLIKLKAENGKNKEKEAELKDLMKDDLFEDTFLD
ncbi:unnamed protein product [Moneuplotes crassus]|uniref:Kinesin-like protein n=1 Tax=Euplotes crassus TaxID=5936 RepID=A0AAD2D806_EUPCR|nr:unnamed protein product [Moneuplotes crassus]